MLSRAVITTSAMAALCGCLCPPQGYTFKASGPLEFAITK